MVGPAVSVKAEAKQGSYEICVKFPFFPNAAHRVCRGAKFVD
jgi:hypothetical protein